MMTTFSPKRPYFLRALHEWLTDNELTPYLMVDSTHEGLQAPIEYAQDGKLVLNIGYIATKDLMIDNDYISFSARFGGVSQEIWVPMASVIGIFAKEDQAHALFFDPKEYANVASFNATVKEDKPKAKTTTNKATTNKPKPTLKIIK